MVSNRQSGFTIVELIISLVVVSALLIPITVASIYFLGAMFDYSTRASLEAETQGAIRTISNDIRGANEILASTSVNDPNKSGGWTTNLEDKVLVINTSALRADQSVIFDLSTNEPYLNEMVYYLEGSTLKKRNLPTTVTGNVMLRTCPDSSASTSCPADTTLATRVSSLSYTLYDYSDTVTTDLSKVSSVEIAIVSEKSTMKTPMAVERSLRITRRGIR